MGRPVIHDRNCNSHFASLGLCEKELGEVSGKKVLSRREDLYTWKIEWGAGNEDTVDDGCGPFRVFGHSTAGLGG